MVALSRLGAVLLQAPVPCRKTAVFLSHARVACALLLTLNAHACGVGNTGSGSNAVTFTQPAFLRILHERDAAGRTPRSRWMLWTPTALWFRPQHVKTYLYDCAAYACAHENRTTTPPFTASLCLPGTCTRLPPFRIAGDTRTRLRFCNKPNLSRSSRFAFALYTYIWFARQRCAFAHTPFYHRTRGNINRLRTMCRHKHL